MVLSLNPEVLVVIAAPYRIITGQACSWAAIQKVFAVFYHNALKKNMPENLELPGDMM